MGYISNAKYYLEAYEATDDPTEQVQTLEAAIAEIQVLIARIKEKD